MYRTEILFIFQHWNREVRLILYDRAWLSEKLLFSKLFPKMLYLTCRGIQSLSLLAVCINITNFVCLCRSNEAFWRIICWTKVVQRVKLYHMRLVSPLYSNAEKWPKSSLSSLCVFQMGELWISWISQNPQGWQSGIIQIWIQHHQNRGNQSKNIRQTTKQGHAKNLSLAPGL